MAIWFFTYGVLIFFFFFFPFLMFWLPFDFDQSLCLSSLVVGPSFQNENGDVLGY